MIFNPKTLTTPLPHENRGRGEVMVPTMWATELVLLFCFLFLHYFVV